MVDGLAPQPLDDSMWDCVVALTKLRIRILRNGDSLTEYQRDEYAKQLLEAIKLVTDCPWATGS